LAILVLSACASADKTSASGDSVKVPAAHEAARHPVKAVRSATGKPLPFADDEARRTVYFALGDTLIDPDGVEVLRLNAQRLKEDPQLVVVLVGHTDNLGSAALNLAVADKRTEAVSERLRSLGVPRNQIRRQAVGSEQSSKSKCDSESCRWSMRRVELVYDRR
jgi:outer membrane protein OmpA-like peptidoglycan-associated protein